MRLLRSIWLRGIVLGFFAGFYLGAVLISWLILPLVSLGLRDEKARIRRSQQVILTSMRFFHFCMRHLRILTGDPALTPIQLPREPCVIIANHPTLIDVTAILAAMDGMTCVVKPSLFRSFAIGPVLRQAWFIPAGADVIREAQTRLEGGLHVLIFPEGTRSPITGMEPFRRGAFEIACRAGVPVVPLLLRADPPFLNKELPWHAERSGASHLTVTQLPTLDPAQWRGDSRAMRGAAEAMYRRALAAPPEAPVALDPLPEALSA